MAFTMERWYAASAHRFAVRKYANGPDSQMLSALERQADMLSTRGVRIVLGESPKAFTGMFLGAGKVRGTEAFAAFLAGGDADLRNVGYLGEAFVLECTALGLATCWLGLYNKKAVAQALDMKEGERLTCITPLGAGAQEYVARPRKELEKLTGLTQEALQSLPEWQRFALACARRAPSATNAQPWQFLVEGERLIVRNTGGNYGFGLLDCGIAMLHMELGAAHGGVAGDWVFDGADAVFTPAMAEEAPQDYEEYYEQEHEAGQDYPEYDEDLPTDDD